MKLSDYIRTTGDKVFAKRFGVTERAAISWRLGERRPRPQIAQRIVDTTPVTWEGIYGSEAERSRRS